MHSSRMRTDRSSSRCGGCVHQAPPDYAPPWDQTPTPLGPDTPRNQTPQDQVPPGTGTPLDRHTPVNILPCPKLRLRAVIISTIELTDVPSWCRSIILLPLFFSRNEMQKVLECFGGEIIRIFM